VLHKLGALSNRGISERRNPHRDSKETKDGRKYFYRNDQSPEKAQGPIRKL
jgi:hypothetical protein